MLNKYRYELGGVEERKKDRTDERARKEEREMSQRNKTIRHGLWWQFWKRRKN